MPAQPSTSPRFHNIRVETNRPEEAVLDEVYRKFANSNPFLPITHFIDHATMGPEALVGLGMGAKVEQWVSRHRVRPYAPPTTGDSNRSAWKAWLGRRDAHGNWLKLLERELENNAFEDVLARWVPRFAHEVGAFLFHGLIRTAHAVRALEHKDTPARRGELARGLALWAIGVRTVPSDTAPEPSRELDLASKCATLARVGAATLIHEPNVPNVHLVTGPMAYLLIARHVDATTHQTALTSFAVTHARAIRGFESRRARAVSAPIASLDERWLDSLVTQTDAHPIKLTEAALRAFDQTEDEIFLRAAGRARRLHTLRGLLGIVKAMASRRVG